MLAFCCPFDDILYYKRFILWRTLWTVRLVVKELKSVKTKIIALVLCCIIASSAAIGGASIINSRRVVADDSAQIMDLLCENRVSVINTLFNRVEQSVETLKIYALYQLDDFQRFKSDADYVDDYARGLLNVALTAAENTAGALTVYIRFNPDFTDPESGIFCGRDTNGTTFRQLAPTNLNAYPATDTSHVGWYYEPVEMGEGIWMDPYFNDNLGVEILTYATPFYLANELVGVVGMDIDFAVLQRVVSETNVYRTGYAFLTTDQARVVQHKDLPRGVDLTVYNRGEFRDMARELVKGESNGSGLLSYTYGGAAKKAAFRSLSNGMRLVITAPASEIDEQANQLLVQIIVAVLAVIAAAVVLTVLFTRRLVRPLQELTRAAEKIAAGDLSVSITHQSNDEVGALAESFRQTVAHLHQYISYINELAYRDSLTGVKNKTAYLEMIQQMDELTRLKRPQYAVVVFDINGLKVINDTLGHDFGDMLIRSSCQIICKVFRRSPIYRIGGDEFVALLENSDYEQYMELLERLQTELDAYNKDPLNEIKVSIARGIAVFSEETDLTYHDVFQRADNAMYRNKEEMKRRDHNSL